VYTKEVGKLNCRRKIEIKELAIVRPEPKVLEHGRQCARTPQAQDVTPSGMMGNEVKVKVDKLTKFISTKYFNKLKFLIVIRRFTEVKSRRSIKTY
jgi:hypothetical protein